MVLRYLRNLRCLILWGIEGICIMTHHALDRTRSVALYEGQVRVHAQVGPHMDDSMKQ